MPSSPCLFETIRVREGRLPFLDAHLSRLTVSARALGLPAPRPELAERLRAHASSGELVLRATLGAEAERIETRPVPQAGPMHVVISGVTHRPYRHKTTERSAFDAAHAEARPRGADEALLLTREGYLSEACIATLFFWSDELLCTPDLALGILPGIARSRVVEIARAAGFPVAHGRFVPGALDGGAVFLANAVRGVVEVAELDGREVPRDPRCAVLASAFWPGAS